MDEIKDVELEKLLSQAAIRERRAFKRATVYTAIPVLIGLVLVGLSAYQLTKLDERKRAKEHEIAEKEKEIESLKTETAHLAEENANTLEQVNQNKLTLDKIKQTLEEAKASNNPKKEIDTALNLVKATDAATKPVEKTIGSGRWIIFSNERTLEEAQYELSRAQKLGYKNISIFFRDPWYFSIFFRDPWYFVVIEFPTAAEARKRLLEIRARLHDGAYLRNVEQICPTPKRQDGYLQCE